MTDLAVLLLGIGVGVFVPMACVGYIVVGKLDRIIKLLERAPEKDFSP